jgi:ribulose-phosphate 3-epimerase
MRKLSVSILAADFCRLEKEIETLEEAGADWIHIDVTDGHFVPNITMGPVLVKAIRRVTALPLDVHLMIENPDRYVDAFVDAGADWLGVHVEAATHLHRTLQAINKAGAKATATLNPATPLDCLDHVLDQVQMVLQMTVNPGFSGQAFIPGMLPKIVRLRKRIDESQLPVLLQVDGGINRNTVDDVRKAGADVVVAASAVFKKRAVAENVRWLKQRLNMDHV